MIGHSEQIIAVSATKNMKDGQDLFANNHAHIVEVKHALI